MVIALNMGPKSTLKLSTSFPNQSTEHSAAERQMVMSLEYSRGLVEPGPGAGGEGRDGWIWRAAAVAAVQP